jgi:hypothetical protein
MNEFITIKEASQLCNANDATIWKWAILDKWLHHLHNPHTKPTVLVDKEQIIKLGKIHWITDSVRKINQQFKISKRSLYNWNKSHLEGFHFLRIPYDRGEQYLDDEMFALAKKLAEGKEEREKHIREENHIKCMIKIKEKARIRQELKEQLKQQKIQLKQQITQDKLKQKQLKFQRKKLIRLMKQSTRNLIIQLKKMCKKIQKSKKKSINQIKKNIYKFKNPIKLKPIKIIKEQIILPHYTIIEYLDFLLNEKSEELQKIYNNNEEVSFLKRKINELIKTIKTVEFIQIHNLKYLLSYLKNKDCECDNKIRMCHLLKFLHSEKSQSCCSNLLIK